MRAGSRRVELHTGLTRLREALVEGAQQGRRVVECVRGPAVAVVAAVDARDWKVGLGASRRAHLGPGNVAAETKPTDGCSMDTGDPGQGYMRARVVVVVAAAAAVVVVVAAAAAAVVVVVV